MITYNRSDNRNVLMDDFSREYVVDSNISELNKKKQMQFSKAMMNINHISIR